MKTMAPTGMCACNTSTWATNKKSTTLALAVELLCLQTHASYVHWQEYFKSKGRGVVSAPHRKHHTGHLAL